MEIKLFILMMKKRIVLILFLALVISMYSQLNKADVESYSLVYDIGKYPSPDDRYEVVLQLCPSDIDRKITYIRGTLNEIKAHSIGSKVIYWDKVQSNDLINVEWIDLSTVKIENVKFDISNFPNIDYYDYRKK